MLENKTNACGTVKKSAGEIKEWVVKELSNKLGIPQNKLDVRLPFSNYGVDSATAVILTGNLGRWMGRELPATLLWDFPTTEQLAEFLVNEEIKIPSQKAVSSDGSRNTQSEPIAIVGIGCRFPGVNGPEEFWKALHDGVDLISEFPQDRLGGRSTNGSSQDQSSSWLGGFIDKPQYFDHSFFGISPREAKLMDPQQRILLELTWEAFEDAGIPVQSLAESMTGVFVGISNSDYLNTCIGARGKNDIYSITGNAFSIAANRISYQFDFRGPSVAIDTACSSSLVAVHQACNGIRLGECDMAVAAGVNILLDKTITNIFDRAGMMAKDGRCKTFDASADGYVRGEGAGVVILKPLSKAIEDGNHIYALVRGSAINQDGKSNGITAPNRLSQEALLAETYRRAGIAPSEVQYIEAHGTGTALGDPIEVKAIGKVLSNGRPTGSNVRIGSVKTNIGHLESAAGIAGIIKTALSLSKKEIPPSLSFNKPNEHIAFEDLQVSVQNKLIPWPDQNGKRYAGVSSFGFGGTNSHVVLEGFDNIEVKTVSTPDNQQLLLPLSARSPKALYRAVEKYLEFIDMNPDASIGDICAGAAKKRDHHQFRAAFTGNSKHQITDLLRQYLKDETVKGTFTKEFSTNANMKLAFVFSGQGPGELALGKELIETEPVFFEKFKECDEVFKKIAGWSIVEEIKKEGKGSGFCKTKVAQPIIFSIQVSLAELWRSWGIVPEAVVGHSVGEIAAAYCSGAISLIDAAKIVYNRSELMDSITGLGKMAAVQLPVQEVEEIIREFEGELCIAANNGSESVVISGDRRALEKALNIFCERRIPCKLLGVDYAFHSCQTEPLVEKLNDALKGIKPEFPVIDIYSTLTGKLADMKSFSSKYWGMQMRNPVRFAEAIKALMEDEFNMFIELNHKPILSGDILKNGAHLGKECLAIPAVGKGKDGSSEVRGALARAYVNGYGVDWSKVFGGCPNYVKLPVYPWQREYCWVMTAQRHPDLSEAEMAVVQEEINNSGRCMENNHSEVSVNIIDRLLPEDEEARKLILLEYLKSQAGRVLQISSDELDVEQPLNTMGIDSIMTVEIRNRVQNDLKISIPLVKLMDGVSIAGVADDILQRIEEVLEKEFTEECEVLEEQQTERDSEELDVSIMDLSEDELNSMLGNLMENYSLTSV